MTSDLAAHWLLSDGFGAALIRPDGELDWWCTPRFDATPTLWSLLDRTGASAQFAQVTALEVSDMPIGATTRTRLRAPCGTVEVWDGLVARRIIRLVRSLDEALDVTHELRLGGFDDRRAQGPFCTR